jgi:hypothetical protein
MNNLKTRLVVIAMLFSMVSFGQHEHAPAKDLLKDKATQDSIMTAITNDHQMMDNMMNHMMQNKHTMHQMMQNKEMMQRITEGIAKDSSKCEKMMAMMMDNKDMHEMMMTMMMKKDKMSGEDDMKQDSTAKKDHSGHH